MKFLIFRREKMSNLIINPVLQKHIDEKDIPKIANDLGVIVYSDKTLSDQQLEKTVNYIQSKFPEIYEKLIEQCDEEKFPRVTKDGKILVKEINEDTFSDALFALTNNFCFERIEDVKVLGNSLYPKPQKVESAEKSVGESKSPQKKRKKNGEIIKIILGIAVIVVVIVVIRMITT